MLCNTKNPDMPIDEKGFTRIVAEYPKQCCIRCSREVLRLNAKKEEESKDFSQLRSLFHRLWTKSVGQLAYDKKEWQQFETMLRKFGINI